MGDFSDIVGRIGLSLPVQTGASTSATTASDLDTAVETALTRDSGHTVISATTAGYQVVPFGPEQDLYAPPVLTVDPPVGQALTFNGGDRVYVSSNPNAPDPRSGGLPGLNAFYRL